MIKNYRKTKILATIGPSSEKITRIEKLILSGVDAFRINCSHTTDFQFKNYLCIHLNVFRQHACFGFLCLDGR